MELSDRVRLKRLELGLTQDELAKIMGYASRVSINKIENGRPISQKIIERLAKALNTTPAYLMGWEEEPKIQSNPPKNATNDLIGHNLKTIRESKNITVDEVSKEFNISVKDLKAYESGLKKIPFELLKRLADYFNMDLNYNIGFDYYKKENQSNLQTSLHILEMTKRWNEEVGEANFTNEEVTELINFAKYLLSKRKDKK